MKDELKEKLSQPGYILTKEDIQEILSYVPKEVPWTQGPNWRIHKIMAAYKVLKQYEKAPLYYKTRDNLKRYGGRLGLIKEYCKLIFYFIFRK